MPSWAVFHPVNSRMDETLQISYRDRNETAREKKKDKLYGWQG
jgi:hypothetical protein